MQRRNIRCEQSAGRAFLLLTSSLFCRFSSFGIRERKREKKKSKMTGRTDSVREKIRVCVCVFCVSVCLHSCDPSPLLERLFPSLARSVVLQFHTSHAWLGGYSENQTERTKVTKMSVLALASIDI